MVSPVPTALNTTLERLHQQIEVFIEGVQPTLVVFIDETNRDLEDMMQALDIPTKVFRVKKFLVNHTPEYYSPDSNEQTLETEPVEKGQTEEYDIIELLLKETNERFKSIMKEKDLEKYYRNWLLDSHSTRFLFSKAITFLSRNGYSRTIISISLFIIFELHQFYTLELYHYSISVI